MGPVPTSGLREGAAFAGASYLLHPGATSVAHAPTGGLAVRPGGIGALFPDPLYQQLYGGWMGHSSASGSPYSATPSESSPARRPGPLADYETQRSPTSGAMDEEDEGEGEGLERATDDGASHTSPAAAARVHHGGMCFGLAGATHGQPGRDPPAQPATAQAAATAAAEAVAAVAHAGHPSHPSPHYHRTRRETVEPGEQFAGRGSGGGGAQAERARAAPSAGSASSADPQADGATTIITDAALAFFHGVPGRRGRRTERPPYIPPPNALTAAAAAAATAAAARSSRFGIPGLLGQRGAASVSAAAASAARRLRRITRRARRGEAGDSADEDEDEDEEGSEGEEDESEEADGEVAFLRAAARVGPEEAVAAVLAQNLPPEQERQLLNTLFGALGRSEAAPRLPPPPPTGGTTAAPEQPHGCVEGWMDRYAMRTRDQPPSIAPFAPLSLTGTASRW